MAGSRTTESKAAVRKRSLESADETRGFPKGRLEILFSDGVNSPRQ
jgi:hypothetical protein